MAHRIDKSLFVEELRQEFDNKVDGVNGTLDWEQITNKPQLADEHWRSPVATFNDLPSINNKEEDIRLVLNTNEVYSWDGIEWTLIGANDTNVEWSHIQNKPTEFTPENHTHIETDITDLDKYTKQEVDTALSGKSDINHNHTLSSLSEKSYNSLNDIPSEFTPKSHTHTESEISDFKSYSLSTHNHTLNSLIEKSYNSLTDVPSEFPPESHTHTEGEITDLDKYTQEEVDIALSGKANLNHDHDGRYHTKSEITSLLNNKANIIHTHTESQITDLDKYTKAEIDAMMSGAGNGDMLKSIYDTNNSGIVDEAESVDWDGVQNKPVTFSPSIHNHTLANITDSGDLAGLNTNGSTTSYLRGNGTWATPPNTTYSEITTAEIDAGASSTARTISGRRVKYIVDSVKRYHVGTTAPINVNKLWIDTSI